jgi:hypothetical protein
MKVKNLIETLKGFNQNKEIVFYHEGGIIEND